MSGNNRLRVFLIFIYLVCLAGLFYFTQTYQKDRISVLLDKQLSNLETQYQLFLKNNSNLADLIYDELVLKEDVIELFKQAKLQKENPEQLKLIREELLTLLSTSYKNYKKQNLLQFQFVFEDNISFLRMHKPSKYGDDLTSIRVDFEEVNKTKKIVRGFVQGKIAHGFRNVYPLFDKEKNYIGAVELSFESFLLQKYLETIGDTHSHFLIKKEIFNDKTLGEKSLLLNYSQSTEHEDYLVSNTKEHAGAQFINKKNENKKMIKDLKESIKIGFENKKPFSLYSLYNSDGKIISFHPIKQAVTEEIPAWIITYEEEKFIQIVINNSNTLRVAVGFMLLIILMFINRILIQQKELEEEKIKAQRASNAKSEFLANMSHEIRTPLNGIIGLTEIVLKTKLNETQEDYLLKAKSSSNALLNVINDILDYSKIEAGKIDINIQEFKLQDLLDNVSNLFGYQIHQKKLKLIFNLQKDIPELLIGDSLRIMQILNNLVGNAVKFTHEGTISVDIKIKQKDETQKNVRLSFCIKDTGIGISEKNINKLFTAFEQGDNSSTREYGGTGLGLLISKKITNLMDGDIWVESTLGEGTQFYFDILLQYSKEKSIMKKDLKSLENKEILIVEDNEIEREYLLGILNSWKAKITQAKDGLEALKLIEKNRYDFIFLDWQMPRLNGIEVLHALKEQNHDISSIMMITAYEKSELLKIADSQNIKIAKILTKPYTPSVLLNTLIRDINKKRASKENSLDNKTEEAEKSEKTSKILLVEDNPINQIVALEKLKTYGEIDIANDGLEALEKAKDEKYDLIFMDLHMPNMDGFEASRKIRELNIQTPIVALSAAVMQKDKELTCEAGMNTHISKPINNEELEEVIMKYL